MLILIFYYIVSSVGSYDERPCCIVPPHSYGGTFCSVIFMPCFHTSFLLLPLGPCEVPRRSVRMVEPNMIDSSPVCIHTPVTQYRSTMRMSPVGEGISEFSSTPCGCLTLSEIRNNPITVLCQSGFWKHRGTFIPPMLL